MGQEPRLGLQGEEDLKFSQAKPSRTLSEPCCSLQVPAEAINGTYIDKKWWVRMHWTGHRKT